MGYFRTLVSSASLDFGLLISYFDFMQNNCQQSITDDADVARPINDKLKRQARTLGQALGFVITQLRVKKKWSQGDLARKSGFEVTTINRLEQGKANPTMALVIAMADSFGLRPSELLARAERKCMKQGQTTLPVTASHPKEKR
jgi:DNA-binding XRE family transcriptional regulator